MHQEGNRQEKHDGQIVRISQKAHQGGPRTFNQIFLGLPVGERHNGYDAVEKRYGDQEIFSIQELIGKFSLENVSASASVFDTEKLRWLNGYYIRQKSPDELLPLLKPFLNKLNYPQKPDEYIKKAIATLQPRCATLEEMAEAMKFYMTDNFEYDGKGVKKFFTDQLRPLWRIIINEINSMSHFDEEKLEAFFRSLAEEKGIKLRNLAQPVRIALTGKTASPGLFEVMDILGKEEVVRRLERAYCLFDQQG